MQLKKQLQHWLEAIQKALACYNKQATLMSPPHQRLEWKEVLEYTFLAKFDLLRFSCEDIWVKQWAQAANWEAMSKYFKLKGMHEEID